MSDVVTDRVAFDSPYFLETHHTCESDGSGETNAIKQDKSAYVAAGGAEPAALDIAYLRYNAQGFTRIVVQWRHTTNDTAMILNGNGSGEEDFALRIPPKDRGEAAVLADPRSAGGTGDVVITTYGATNGASYDITIGSRKRKD